MNLRTLATKLHLTGDSNAIAKHHRAIDLLNQRIANTPQPQAREACAELIAAHYERIAERLDKSWITRRLSVMDAGTARMLAAEYQTDAFAYERQADCSPGWHVVHGGAEAGDQPERQEAWRPTARSAYGRYIQAAQFRQAAIEAIHQRGIDRNIDPQDVMAAYDRLDDDLRARGWHPDQFDHGFDDEAPIDDFMNRTDVDYDPAMAAFDQRQRAAGDEY